MTFNTFNKALVLGLVVTSSGAIAGGHSNDMAPAEVQPPAGHVKFLSTTAIGTVAWDCVDDGKGGAMTQFAGPAAVLSVDGKPTISYYSRGGATWEARDGSILTGKQIAIHPSDVPDTIPHQLVSADDSPKAGVLVGTSYIQRTDLMGGKAPAGWCGVDQIGQRVLVAYTGTYNFFKPM